jgi:hypothetical protein
MWTGFCFLGAVTFEQLERDHEIQVRAEPEFVNLLRSQGIDSQPSGPVRNFYLTYRPTLLMRLAESIPGLLKHLKIRVQTSEK